MSISAASSSSASLSQLRSMFAQIDGSKSSSVSSGETGSATASSSATSNAFAALSQLAGGSETSSESGTSGQAFESAFGKLSTEMQSMLMGLQEDTASAQGPSFGTLDADASGGLSYEEFAAGAPDDLTSDSAALESLFSAIDGDGDGAISSDEFSAMTEGANAGGAPPPPPPAASSDSGSSTSSDSSSGSAGAAGGSSGSLSGKQVESQSTVTKADGSSTTTITYTDGTTETTTTPATPKTGDAEGGQGRPADDMLRAALSAYASSATSSMSASTTMSVAA